MKRLYIFVLFLLSTFCFLLSGLALADDFTSNNFKVLDSVLFSGIYSSSTGYQLFGAISQVSIGTSTAASFNLSSGFLHFPYVSTPVVAATAGNGQVSLSWTASQGFLGWTVSGYNVGKSTVSSGPYTYTSVGNVFSSTRTNLTNGTTYYFVIRSEDAFGNSIATSTEVSATPVAPVACGDGSCNGSETCGTCPADCGTCPSGGGGGGGAYIPPLVETKVIFSGRAYPKSAVTLLKDAQIAATTIAGADANFQISISGLSGGNYIFSLYSEDREGRRSSLLTFPISVTAGATTQVSGIFISPTIDVDKSEVKRGDNIAIFGQSAPQADMVISVASDEEFFGKTISDKDGIYLYNFDTSPLAMEQHFTKSKAAKDGAISSYSTAIGFLVGTKNVAKAVTKCGKADLNCDQRVNLVDFSIAAYWYKRPLSEAFKIIEKERLSGDSKIDLVDFSIMAYYWTG